MQVNYNSQHAQGAGLRLRRPARAGVPGTWDFSMAVFADLDLKAGSDLKALRGLVETAAHRESVWLCGSQRLPLATPKPWGVVR